MSAEIVNGICAQFVQLEGGEHVNAERAVRDDPALRELHLFMEGAVAVQQHLLRPRHSSLFPAPEARLIDFIWGDRPPQKKTDVDMCWLRFVGLVHDTCDDGTTMNMEELKSVIVQVITNYFDIRNIMYNVEENSLLELVRDELKRLEPKRQEVLRMYFGFDEAPRSLPQIGRDLGYSGSSRASQLFSSGCRSVVFALVSRLQTVGSLEEEVRRLQASATDRSEFSADLQDKLDREVGTLPVSQRTKDILRKASVNHVGVLVQMEKHEVKNRCGLSSNGARQLEWILFEQGLRFGMRIPGWNPPK